MGVAAVACMVVVHLIALDDDCCCCLGPGGGDGDSQCRWKIRREIGRPGGPDPPPPPPPDSKVSQVHTPLGACLNLDSTVSVRELRPFARRHISLGLVALSRPHAVHAHSCPLHVCGGQQEPLQLPVVGAGVCLPQAPRVRGEGASALSSRFPGHPSLHLFLGELPEPWMLSPPQPIVT